MTDNKKAARLGTGTASNTANDSRNHTGSDPLMGWHGLAAGVDKPSRIGRKQKSSWKRGRK